MATPTEKSVIDGLRALAQGLETYLPNESFFYASESHTGAEVIALQAAEQFERYTGVRPTAEQVAAASAMSRACPLVGVDHQYRSANLLRRMGVGSGVGQSGLDEPVDRRVHGRRGGWGIGRQWELEV